MLDFLLLLFVALVLVQRLMFVRSRLPLHGTGSLGLLCTNDMLLALQCLSSQAFATCCKEFVDACGRTRWQSIVALLIVGAWSQDSEPPNGSKKTFAP